MDVDHGRNALGSLEMSENHVNNLCITLISIQITRVLCSQLNLHSQHFLNYHHTMRADKRPPTALRPLQITLGELSRADGSGRFAFGPCASLASFTGPIEVRIKDEKVDRATLEITHRPLQGVGGVPSRELEDTLRGVFEPLLNLAAFPRALVQLVVQSLVPAPEVEVEAAQRDGSKQQSWTGGVVEALESSPPGGESLVSKASAINAATLAAMNAGSVGMRAVPLAVAVAILPGGEVVLDPTEEEEAGAVARFGFAWAYGAGVGAGVGAGQEDDADEELVWVEGEGEFTRKDVSLVSPR